MPIIEFLEEDLPPSEEGRQEIRDQINTAKQRRDLRKRQRGWLDAIERQFDDHGFLTPARRTQLNTLSED
jgi:hypothetical protein